MNFNLSVAQPARKFKALYRTLRFSTVLTKACHALLAMFPPPRSVTFGFYINYV
jgi:hypothetical protein